MHSAVNRDHGIRHMIAVRKRKPTMYWGNHVPDAMFVSKSWSFSITLEHRAATTA